MKLIEYPHQIKYPEHCLFLLDIFDDNMQMCLNKLGNNPSGEIFMRGMNVNIYGNFKECPKNEIEDLIISKAMDASSSSLIPANYDFERKRFFQEFNSSPFTLPLSDIKDSLDESSYKFYSQETIKNLILVPQWKNNTNVFISIINAPFYAHGPASYCYYRIHNISEKKCSCWIPSVKLALFLYDYKFLRTI